MSTATANGFRDMPSANTAETALPAFAGIVLAGGASSRMGEDKAMLRLSNGSTLLDHALAMLQAAGADPVIVSGDRPEHAGIADLSPLPGPLGGLASVLRARRELQGRLLLAVPIDTPALGAEALRNLVRAASDSPGACYTGHPLPLALWADGAVTQRLEAVLDGTAPAAVHRLIADFGLRQLPADAVDLTNLNAPDDWSGYRQRP